LVAFHAMQKHEWSDSMALLPTLRSKNQNPADPFAAFRRELDSIFADYNRVLPTLAEVGARIPALNIAETKDAIEITTELPGVDEKDINVSLDDNRLVISGEKKQESDRTDKEWHVVERSYGAFHRAIALPFEPNEASIEAHFDKGVLHLKVKKPAEVEKAKKTIEIKAGPPESPAAKIA
jgi:HSP20 family protein